jgi:hypothetical protein
VELPALAAVAAVGCLKAVARHLLPPLPPLPPLSEIPGVAHAYAAAVAATCVSWGLRPGPLPPLPNLRVTPLWPGTIGGGALAPALGPRLTYPPFEALNNAAPRLALPGVRASNVPHHLLRAYRSSFVGLPAAPTALRGEVAGGKVGRPWPQEAPIDGRPLMAGSPRPWGGDWGGAGGQAYEAGRRVSHVR